MTHVREVVGLNPGDVYWMLDGLDIFYIVKIELFVWKNQNKTKKSPGWPNLKKSFASLFLDRLNAASQPVIFPFRRKNEL